GESTGRRVVAPAPGPSDVRTGGRRGRTSSNVSQCPHEEGDTASTVSPCSLLVAGRGQMFRVFLERSDAHLAPVQGVDALHGGGERLHGGQAGQDRKSTRLNSSHVKISYAVFC